VSEFHKYLGYIVPVGFGILALWAFISFFRNRNPEGWFWNLLAFLQVVIGIQVIVGAVLFFSGLAPPTDPVWLHYAYGGLFPAALLVGAHRIARNYEGLPGLIFGIASVLICGLTLRALMTGLGS
jgi:heme A synthase